MNGSIGVGSVAGIRIRVHWSFLLVLPLLAYLFGRTFVAAARLAGVPPEQLGGSPVLWGLGVAVVLFLSVLVHELAHALYGRAKGAEVTDITLLMIGGVSRMAEPPKRLRDEAVMAFVGPLSSLIIGAAFYVLYRLIDISSFDLRFAIFYVAQLNLVLGVFNLLPAFPMDGGRVLRAVLAGRLGMVRGTQVAAGLGKAVAVLFAFWGVLSFNLLLLIIAYFVYLGAQGEARLVTLRAALGHIPVRDMMLPSTSSSDADETLAAAAEKMQRERRLSLPVTEADRVVGVVSFDQIARVPQADRASTRVRAIAIVAPVVSPDDEVWDGVRELEKANLPHLPVVENGRLVGALRLEDVMRGLQLHEAFPQKRPAGRWPGRREAEA
ncbi:MAG: site-2 protease family protein [Myxococcaceae bacterium]